VESDRGWVGVAGAGWFVGFFGAVTVVAGAFDRAGTGAFPAFGDEQDGDGVEVDGKLVIPVLRGDCPPFRWRCGGSNAGCW
jgi:hypothetical protein